jgi:hypothetical protein
MTDGSLSVLEPEDDASLTERPVDVAETAPFQYSARPAGPDELVAVTALF